ncbi:MAG: major facilitator superfamily 1 [Proteobacteria bacterium]|nr:major facilitator superfamily 1 [Pseudomonadota bacterium]
MHLPPADVKDGDADAYKVSKRYAWLVFGMTFLLMLFDFIDRQIIVSMFPHLKAEWDLSDKQLGALVSAVSLTVALGSIPTAILVDRWSRVKSIAIMAGVWSLATIACAFSRNYGQLLAARSVIGVGEAGYGAAGGALLSSIFPARMRSTVLGAFLAAASLGSVLGVILGGVIATHWGWRAAFGVVGIPGLVLALLFLLVRDYKTVRLVQPGGSGSALGAKGALALLFRPRTVIAMCLGGAMQLFVVGTIYAWLPSFLNRFYGLAPDQAGIKAAIVVLLGAIGSVVWGLVADRMGRSRPRAKITTLAVLSVGTTVVFVTAFGFMAPGNGQFALIALGGFLMTATVGPVGAVTIDVVHPGLRATAAATVALFQNLLGLAAGPFVAGVLSDALGLQAAMAITPFACLLAALAFVAAARSYEPDLAKVGDLDVEMDGAPLRAAPVAA